MIKGKLKNGFEYTVDEDVFNDMELIDAIRDSMGKDPTRVSDVVDKVLGDNKQKLYDLLRNEQGRVPADAVADSISEIISSAGETGKN